MSFKKKSRFIFCTTFLLTVLMLCGFTFAMGYANNSNKNAQRNPQLGTPNTEKRVAFDLRIEKADDSAINISTIYSNMSTLEMISSTKEIPQTYDDINSTKYSKKNHFEMIDGDNYFSWGRIDVVDNSGYAYQAIVFICDGSDSYVKNFNQELEQLSEAYLNNQNRITGYLDLIRDNRLRNFGVENFSAIEKVVITNANGVQYDAYVVAICGSEDFMEPYLAFYEKVIGEYHKNKILK